ncbi:MAG TPA: VWA domain-containing protein [Pyrinomonadaceae bacterium]|jgi:VWFA-related protein
MISRTAATLACLCLCFSLPTGSPAQTRERRAAQQPKPTATREEVDEGEVVRVETTLVTIPVSITDRDGRYIPDLRKEDFRIYEDGVEQEIAYFAAVEKPFTVVLMLDTSSSVWRELGRIRRAAHAFVAQLRPEDQVMVTSFAGGLTIHSEATGDRQKIKKAIDDVGRGLSTHLYDAMSAMMAKHLKRIQGRKAIVLFTDGVDARSSSKATYEDTVRTAEELDALIYPIRYDTYDPASDNGPAQRAPRLPGILGRLPLPLPGPTTNTGGGGASREAYARGARYLHELADVTGGRFYEASRDLRDLDQVFSHIAEELRRQYSLGYYPQQHGHVGERRRIRVRVTRTDVAVRARNSYIYQPVPSVNVTAQDQKQKPAAPVLKKPLVAARAR